MMILIVRVATAEALATAIELLLVTVIEPVLRAAILLVAKAIQYVMMIN